MTISPALLAELAQATAPVERRLTLPAAAPPLPPAPVSEAEFHAALAVDAMARDKLAEGISQFIADTETLEKLIRAHQG
jgi:transaldolase